ncbi:MAG: translocation/assembly module TamB domain-containing protein, partial [Myxococcota bacterium]|nr:translocation/assembly module TamB domain-containing protein [Myxococcota bacterium]
SAAADNALNFISDDYLEPSLDITAEKVTRAYGTVEAHVTGSPSVPVVRFENAQHPDETDIMSILLFGKPAAELSDSEGQTRAGMLSAAIGMMARNSLNLALGGGTLRTEVDFDEDSFRVGRPHSDRVFASFELLAQTEQDDGTFEVTLEWLISRRLYAEVAGGDGGNSADLFWRWRF